MKKENLPLIIISIVLVALFIYSLFFSTPTYTVTFDTDGGSIVASEKVKRNKTVTKPKDPTKEGYKFVSWQVAGVDYDFNYPITSNLTITAKWEEEKTEETKKTITTKKATTTKKSANKKR